MPQKNVDCMPCAACCIGALQTPLAREVAPADSAVISVVQLQVEDGQLLSIMPSRIDLCVLSLYEPSSDCSQGLSRSCMHNLPHAGAHQS